MLTTKFHRWMKSRKNQKRKRAYLEELLRLIEENEIVKEDQLKHVPYDTNPKPLEDMLDGHAAALVLRNINFSKIDERLVASRLLCAVDILTDLNPETTIPNQLAPEILQILSNHTMTFAVGFGVNALSVLSDCVNLEKHYLRYPQLKHLFWNAIMRVSKTEKLALAPLLKLLSVWMKDMSGEEVIRVAQVISRLRKSSLTDNFDMKCQAFIDALLPRLRDLFLLNLGRDYAIKFQKNFSPEAARILEYYKCARCSRIEPICYRCSKCCIYYCSKHCAKIHWEVHKLLCAKCN